ncbi:very-long-chain 3-oxooacyl-coA reductase let-767-like isoform X4 [Varanus komodoensis]|uniref:very-long-chain 3-oxooacyl-coA reductase let-767-like isoform X4 n=1 Tax=Varanus komodoensis TaxID=61221 RepID=UPI001CF787E2|nr:very-long-chain 3-oxooacyl-coA reductase let-767-like isoform X4 [Varanus komodoensis]
MDQTLWFGDMRSGDRYLRQENANRWDPNWLRSYSACLDSKQEVFPRVVTGATSGIGKAYAHELARRGLNVVLISRSLERLRQVAAEIEQKHGRSTKVIQTDFTEGSEIYAPIQAALQGLEIGLLVNNVGMIQEKFDGFLNIPDVGKHINDIVNCNLLSTVKMTELILPQMLARKRRLSPLVQFGRSGPDNQSDGQVRLQYRPELASLAKPGLGPRLCPCCSAFRHAVFCGHRRQAPRAFPFPRSLPVSAAQLALKWNTHRKH